MWLCDHSGVVNHNIALKQILFKYWERGEDAMGRGGVMFTPYWEFHVIIICCTTLYVRYMKISLFWSLKPFGYMKFSFLRVFFYYFMFKTLIWLHEIFVFWVENENSENFMQRIISCCTVLQVLKTPLLPKLLVGTILLPFLTKPGKLKSVILYSVKSQIISSHI